MKKTFFFALLLLSLSACTPTVSPATAQSDAGSQVSSTAASPLGNETQTIPPVSKVDSSMDEAAQMNAATAPSEDDNTVPKNPPSQTELVFEEEIPSDISVVNPMVEVDSSDDFLPLGLSLVMPEDETTYRDAVYHTIAGQTAQISFYDNTTESAATVRAGKLDPETLAGVYYLFDDTKKQTMEITADDGSSIPITVQVVVDGSDIPGALASWTYRGVTYTLWEDNGNESLNAMKEMAAAIAENSTRTKDL